MDDEQLRSRLADSDPMLEGVPIDPADSPSARHLLEAIMSTELDTPNTHDDVHDDAHDSTVRSLPPRRRRWSLAALATAAVGALAVAGAAVGGVFDGGEPNLADQPAVEEPTVLELSGGDVDPMIMSCLPMDASIIAQSPIAFRGVVDSVSGDTVTLTVDRWYQGGDADVVTITAPLGMEALIGGIPFEAGQTYLVSAYDGVVSYCGMSGPATPELQQMYDQAFPG